MTSGFASVSWVELTALCVPEAVTACALIVQVPLCSAATPDELKSAVLKLTVTGDAAASAAELVTMFETVCVLTTESLPHLSVADTVLRTPPLVSTFRITSSCPVTAPRLAGTDWPAAFVWLIEEIVTVGIAPLPLTPVTVTAAAPATLVLAFDVAMTDAVPALLPVTLPLASTEATVLSLEVHVTVRSEMDASASTDAASVEVPPTAKVRLFGDTVTLWTTPGVVVPVNGAELSLQAARPASVSNPTKVERTTRCILPPW
jgi:hypothetical protein